MIFAGKIYKIPEFCMIFAPKMAEFYIIIAPKVFSGILGERTPCPPSPTPMVELQTVQNFEIRQCCDQRTASVPIRLHNRFLQLINSIELRVLACLGRYC